MLLLNVHTHLLTLDGVYVHDGNSDTPELVFFALPEPTAEQVADVARRSADRIKKVLQKHGRELGEIDVAPTESGSEPDALSACYGAVALRAAGSGGRTRSATTHSFQRALLKSYPTVWW